MHFLPKIMEGMFCIMYFTILYTEIFDVNLGTSRVTINIAIWNQGKKLDMTPHTAHGFIYKPFSTVSAVCFHNQILYERYINSKVKAWVF